MDDGMDYDVQTKVRFRLDFDGSGEFNTLSQTILCSRKSAGSWTPGARCIE